MESEVKKYSSEGKGTLEKCPAPQDPTASGPPSYDAEVARACSKHVDACDPSSRALARRASTISQGCTDPRKPDYLIALAEKYNDPEYFKEDPVMFPRHFVELLEENKACLQDVEIAGLLAAHLAWGRRAMIVRDCNRMFDEMDWKPYEYVMAGRYRDEDGSLHRTVKWSEFAAICSRMKDYYSENESLEYLSPDEMRVRIFGQKSDLKAANKKIHMFRRWMVRRDGIIDFGLWRRTDPAELIIPLDVHVHTTALSLGVTNRKSADFSTALEITDYFRKLFPDDPCKGDFALFGYGVTGGNKAEDGRIVDNSCTRD